VTAPSVEEWLSVIRSYANGEVDSRVFLDRFLEFRDSAIDETSYPEPFESLTSDVFFALDDSWLLNAPGVPHDFPNESQLRSWVVERLVRFQQESELQEALDKAWDESP
jgi:hypothetical protein